MTYTPQTWDDNDPLYPVSAARMGHVESGISALDVRLDLVEAWFTLVNTVLRTTRGIAIAGGGHPTTGQSLEAGMTGGAGFIQPHNRDDGHHLPLHLVGSEIDFFIGDPNIQSLTVTETSVDVLGTLTVGGAGIGSVFDDRGKSIIATTESRTNVAYGTLTTPDQVTVTLAADGLLKVLFQATWQESISAAGRAAIFIGANQLKHSVVGNANPEVQEAALGNITTGINLPLHSVGTGLQSYSSSTAYLGDVTTGQALGDGSINNAFGGPCYIFAAAGTYTISVQFKSSSGSVTAKNRKLWVAAETY